MVIQRMLAFFVVFFSSNLLLADNVSPPEDFQITRLFSTKTISNATSVETSPDGRIFITEGSGTLLIFNNELDQNPSETINRGSQAWWDYIWSVTLHPDFPNTPDIFLMITDGIGDVGNNDDTPYTEGYINGSHVIYRVSVNGKSLNWDDRVTIWRGGCVGLSRGHHGADLEFGVDGYLYFTVGEGSTNAYVEREHRGCDDGSGERGGQWKSQDAYHFAGYPDSTELNILDDRTRPNGSLLRIDINDVTHTGTRNGIRYELAGAPDTNPWAGGRVDDDAIIAYGLRNPFKMTLTSKNGFVQAYIADVGDQDWEEINWVDTSVFYAEDSNPIDSVLNFGWPCYEGDGKWDRYVAVQNELNTDICNHFYQSSVSDMHAKPWYKEAHPYRTSETAKVNLSAITAAEVYDGNMFPSELHGALFFANHDRAFIHALLVNEEGELDPSQKFVLIPEPDRDAGETSQVQKVVDLEVANDGSLLFLTHNGNNSRLYKVTYDTAAAAKAVINAESNSGNVGAELTFSAASSTGKGKTYAWDVDNDGQFDDSTSEVVVHQFNALGIYPVSLQVTDQEDRKSVSSMLVYIHDHQLPVVEITEPQPESFKWRVEENFMVSGQAFDTEGQVIPAEQLTWQSGIFHCQPDNPDQCHVHPLNGNPETPSSQFTVTPTEHEMPSRINVKLTAETDTLWAPNWWNTDWQYRQVLFFDNQNGAEYVNVPIFVQFDQSFDYDNAGQNGSSIRFIDANGNELEYKIDSWNAGQLSGAWVIVPSIAEFSYSDYIYLYYGNEEANTTSGNVASGVRNDPSFVQFGLAEKRKNLSATKIVEYTPDTRMLSVASNIDGLIFTQNASQHLVNEPTEVIINNPVLLSTTTPQFVGLEYYNFVQWDNGEANCSEQFHTTVCFYTEFRMPPNDLTVGIETEVGGSCSPAYSEIFVRGTFNDWGVSTMKLNENCEWEYYASSVSSDDVFKFGDADWEIDFGDEGADGFVDHDGDDISIPKSGEALIQFNDNTGQYRVKQPCDPDRDNMYVSGGFNGWSVASTMTYNRFECRWELEVEEYNEGSGLKFRPNSDNWNGSYGDTNNDGIAEQTSGNNIVLNANESILIWFDGRSRRYGYEQLNFNAQPVISLNVPPALDILVNEFITLDASSSADPDGFISSFKWSTGETAQSIDVAFENNGTYEVSVEVTDNLGKSAIQTVTIKVTGGCCDSQFDGIFMPGHHNGWNPQGSALTLVDNKLWQVTVALEAGDGFKFTQGTWEFSYGDNNADGILDTAGGGNIIVPTTGEYIVSFAEDGNQLSYSLELVPEEQPPVADAGADVQIRFNESTLLSASASSDSDGDVVSYLWTLPSGETFDTETISFSNLVPGSYDIALQVIDNDGLTDVDDVIVTVVGNQLPVANAGHDVSIRFDQSVELIASASSDADGTIATYQWDLPDGSLINSESFEYSNATPGEYVIVLTVTDNDGASAEDTINVVVAANTKPAANAGDDLSVRFDSSVELSAEASIDSDGSIVSYLWTLPTGDTYTTASFTFAESTLGQYTISLQVTDNDGAVDEDVVIVSVVGNIDPVADAGADIQIKAGEVTTLSGAASNDSDGDIVSYVWTLPDNSTQMAETIEFSSSIADSYDIQLEVTDNDGGTSIDTVVVTVVANALPVANAGVDQESIVNETVLVDAGLSSDSDGEIVSFSWLLPDGSVVEGQTVSYSASEPGVYELLLTVTDSDGAQDTDSVLVNVTENFDSNWNEIYMAGNHNGWNPAGEVLVLTQHNTWRTEVALIAGQSFKFTIGSWTTSFGDRDANGVADTLGGGNIIVPSPSGNFIVTFNDETLEYSIVPNNGPVAPDANAGNDFTVKVNSVVELNGAGSTDADGSIVSYSWSLPNGNTIQGVSASFVADMVGDYAITLLVTDNDGLTDSDTFQLSVLANTPPVAVIDASSLSIFEGESVTFTDVSSDDSGVQVRNWSGVFTSSERTVSHMFASSGEFEITLEVIDEEGETNTTSLTIIVAEPPSGVEVTFRCERGNTTSGTSVYVVGNIPELGNWSIQSGAQKLDPTSYPIWTKTITIPADTSVNWKCVKANNSSLAISQWESGGNNTFNSGSNGGITTTGRF